MQNSLTIVAISDTHSSTEQLEELIANNVKGDVFIHAGDMTRKGRQEHFINFIKCLRNLEFRHKIVIAGNHDITLDSMMKPEHKEFMLSKYPCSVQLGIVSSRERKLSTRLIPVHTIQGFTFFGSPFTEHYSKGAFQYPRSQDDIFWNIVPEKVDVLITHGPPFGILDQTAKKVNGGSKGLLKVIERVKPKLHIFGHIHEGHGKKERHGIRFVNVAKKFQRLELNR